MNIVLSRYMSVSTMSAKMALENNMSGKVK
jgi:hypothetical protein